MIAERDSFSSLGTRKSIPIHMEDDSTIISQEQGIVDLEHGYFSKFKARVLQLKQCGIEKKDDQLVLAILSKLVPDYSVFFFDLLCHKVDSSILEGA